jgi:hypothetical protein
MRTHALPAPRTSDTCYPTRRASSAWTRDRMTRVVVTRTRRNTDIQYTYQAHAEDCNLKALL